MAKAVILLVEDEPHLREYYTLTLSSAGYTIVAARDGLEALAAIEQQPIDLVLSDISMPRMNGYQLLDRLRERLEWIHIPFLFLSARNLDSDIRYGKQLGADDYLTKPIQPDDLLAAIKGRLHRARQLRRYIAGHNTAERTEAGTQADLIFGSIQIDTKQHRVWRDGQPLHLSPREFVILTMLVSQAGGMVTLRAMVRATHHLEVSDDEAGMLLRPLIKSLRRRLGYTVGEMGCVENVRGLGYRLTA
jgi:DNA-binding response OmpR family regulator